jgi:DNA-binding IclR family transcriptional regulator
MPVQPSPAVIRAGQVLRALAEQPRHPQSLAELARRCDLHRSSCQTVLLALCAEGFVTRHDPGPTYRLGPLLIELGRAAADGRDLLGVADLELVRLRSQFGVSALAGTVARDSIVIAAAQPVPDQFGHSVVAGSRIALRAPIGCVYVAWSAEPAVRAWLDRASPPLSAASKSARREDLETIRRRGWSATVSRADGTRGRRQRTGEATDGDLRGGRLGVVGLSAPVFDERGELACSIALAGFGDDLSGREIRELGAALTAAASRVMQEIGGHAPA